MNQTRTLIEEKGFEVIYGDTDSLFVWIDHSPSNKEANNIGKDLAKHVTQWWQHHLKHQYQLDSALELEYENHYSKFLMPTVRGSYPLMSLLMVHFVRTFPLVCKCWKHVLTGYQSKFAIAL